MLRVLTAGESHGPAITVIIDGLPAGIPISEEYIRQEMLKRKTGVGSGGRQLIENDKVEILSGVRFGKTLGSPICLLIKNNDFINWQEKMTVAKMNKEYQNLIAVTKPRPGHADLIGVLKYHFNDVRNVLERASARETAMRVAAGAIFKQFLLLFNIQIASHTLSIGSVSLERTNYDFEEIKKAYKLNPTTRCLDHKTSKKMENLIQKIRLKKNSLGGSIEVWAINIPPGLGSYVQFDRKIDGQIAQALMSIPSVKAIEIGEALINSQKLGSEVHDAIYYQKNKGFYRQTNRAGGIEGGVTNGMPIICRVYFKPISTLYQPLPTVDIKTKKPALATVERSDICVVPRAGVIVEAMLAYILTQNFLIKFGSDEISEIKQNYHKYCQYLSK